MRGILYDYVLDPLKSFRVDSLLPFPLSSLHLSKVVLLQHPVLDYYSMEVDVLQKKPNRCSQGMLILTPFFCSTAKMHLGP